MLCTALGAEDTQNVKKKGGVLPSNPLITREDRHVIK